MVEDYPVVISNELPVGTKFCFRNMDDLYEVKESNEKYPETHRCKKCAFSFTKETDNVKKGIKCVLCSISSCLATERRDGKSVYFVEVKEK